jgi:hypothetical protein
MFVKVHTITLLRLLCWVAFSVTLVVVGGQELVVANNNVNSEQINPWQTVDDFCRQGEALAVPYTSMAYQPCEMTYFRNEKAIGVKNNFNATICHDGKNGSTDQYQIGERFPFWDSVKSPTLNRSNPSNWWPDFCVGFMPRCYSLGDEAVYVKMQTYQHGLLIPPIPPHATHVRVDCTEDFLSTTNCLAHAIPIGIQTAEKFYPFLGLLGLSFLFSMIGCACWSCFCCCWCVRRRQLKHPRANTGREAVDPEEVNAAQLNNQYVVDRDWREGHRRPHQE